MAKNGLRGSQTDQNIDDHIDALHPGKGPATPSMQDARATQRKILGQKGMPAPSFNDKVRTQMGAVSDFNDRVKNLFRGNR